MGKVCNTCKIDKPLDEFCNDRTRSDGKMSRCKACDRIRVSERNKKRRLEDPIYRNRETKKRRVRKNKQMERDPVVAFKYKIRDKISTWVRDRGHSKRIKSEEILGIPYDDFIQHLGGLFTEGMAWDNYGDWHIDHIIPISSAVTYEEVIKLNHYTNLQPLWAEDNIRKSNKIL